MKTIVPVPVSVSPSDQGYALTGTTIIQAESPEAVRVAETLAVGLRRATGFPLVVGPEPGGIRFTLRADPVLGAEGYRLVVDAAGVRITAGTEAGLFHGAQTLRQLLPPAADAGTPQPGPWPVPGGEVLDHPRFGYRGAMLDVARHFFPVATVCRYIEQLARYKINHLHLHLTDDQGWRIAIAGWPRLTEHGARTEVDGGPGGYYTQSDYRSIVAHAAAHHITVVPEVDTPGHVNAALASYPELTEDGQAPELYTGIEVGFSTLSVHREVTYRFLDEVLAELAELTPGPYLHIGGDEAQSTTETDYQTFADRAVPLVGKHGKTAITWHELARTNPLADTILQFWGTSGDAPETIAAVKRGNKLIMSPANRAYLDQKYTEDTELGLKWAAYIEVADAYDWDPATYLADVDDSAILGVEAPLWSETITNTDAMDFLAYPRLPAIAEIAWSPKETHDWADFRARLATHGPRWERQGIAFHRSPDVPWAD